MKKLLVLFSIFAIGSALAYNQAHVDRLTKTGKCQKCDLRGFSDQGIFGQNLAGIKNVDVAGSDLSSSMFRRGSNLKKANFKSTTIEYAYFADADLTGADFTGANLTGTDFGGAILNDTNFTKANFTNAHLKWANLTKATLADNIFKNTSCVTEAMVDKDLRKEFKGHFTQLPKGFSCVKQSKKDQEGVVKKA